MYSLILRPISRLFLSNTLCKKSHCSDNVMKDVNNNTPLNGESQSAMFKGDDFDEKALQGDKDDEEM